MGKVQNTASLNCFKKGMVGIRASFFPVGQRYIPMIYDMPSAELVIEMRGGSIARRSAHMPALIGYSRVKRELVV